MLDLSKGFAALLANFLLYKLSSLEYMTQHNYGLNHSQLNVSCVFTLVTLILH